jgi:hypothetical protein
LDFGFWIAKRWKLKITTGAKKPGFYGKFIILTNGVDEKTGFLGSSWVSPEDISSTSVL